MPRLILLFLLLSLVTTSIGCSKNASYFEQLNNTQEIVVQNNKDTKKIKEDDTIDQMIHIIQDAKRIDPPKKARGINKGVAEQALLLMFINSYGEQCTAVYIGDGYLYIEEDTQYYKVSSNLEKYLSFND